MFANHICDTDLIFRIVRTLTTQKQRQSNLKNGQKTDKNTLEANKTYCLWNSVAGTEE